MKLLVRIFIFVALFTAFPAFCEDKDSILTLTNALQKAIKHSPAIKAAQAKVSIATGELQQSKLWPNPTLALGYDKLGGNKEFAGTREIESELKLQQEIITAGKLSKESRIAAIKHKIAIIEQEIAKLNVKLEVTKKFIRLKILQSSLTTEKKFTELAQKNADAITRKMEAGEIPPIAQTRAQIRLAAAQSRYKMLKRELQTAKIELSSEWGLTAPDFAMVADSNLASYTLDSLITSQETLMAEHPEVKLAGALIELSEAEKSLEKAKTTPDFEIEAGITKERNNRKHFYFAEVRFPLPVFNRNQGKIKAAEAHVTETGHNLKQVCLRVKTRLLELIEELHAVREERNSIETVLLPGAELSHQQMQQAFNQGETELTELFDATKVFLEAQNLYNQTLAEELRIFTKICLHTNQENQLFETCSD
jgi:cobalt-zinc-cadmium efflux system outer membrane protein